MIGNTIKDETSLALSFFSVPEYFGSILSYTANNRSYAKIVWMMTGSHERGPRDKFGCFAKKEHV